jgi:hypothetical protein
LGRDLLSIASVSELLGLCEMEVVSTSDDTTLLMLGTFERCLRQRTLVIECIVAHMSQLLMAILILSLDFGLEVQFSPTSSHLEEFPQKSRSFDADSRMYRHT